MSAIVCGRNLPILLTLGLLLAGCSSSSGPQVGDGHHGRFQVGRPNYTVAPYQVNGVWYRPRVDYDYDETGTASWYGPGFDRRATADGEIYDMNQPTAAHKTLPLPSVVEVTNLQNGRALRLRVNDRGPFIGDRLIDVSRRAAQLLGFEATGTAPVRVRVMKEESIQVAEAAMHSEFGAVAVAAAASATRTEPAGLPRRAPASQPPVQMADAGVPPSLRAQQVVAGPLPSETTPSQAPVAVAALPPVAARSEEPPPPARPVAAAAPRRYWPSLIPQARADTLRPAMLPAMAAVPHSRRIFVQAGAFAVPENAQRARSQLASLGGAEIVPATVHGTALYRVRVGPVGSAAEAERILGKLVGSGYPGARVVDE